MRFCKHGTLLYFKLLFFGELLVLHAITPEIQDVVKRQQILEDKIMKLQEKDKKQTERIVCLENELEVLKEQLNSKMNFSDHHGNTPTFESSNTTVRTKSGFQRHSRLLLKNAPTNITASPRVSGPIAFTARMDPYIVEHVGTNQHIVFGTILTNIGGGYHSLHGLFIVPRSGVYLIASSILADYTTNSNGVHAAIVVNGNTVAKMFAYAERSSHRDQGAQTVFLNLTKNDEVWVKNIDFTDVTIGGEKYATFSGCLIWPFD